MAGSGFFKGEKKKAKKEKSQQNINPTMGQPGQSTFRLPELISKKNKSQ